jgi:hypothetical protein
MRKYFSTYFLFAARHSSLLACEIETTHEGESHLDIEHRGHVLSSILASAAFLESNINEVFQDVYDQHQSSAGSLSTETSRVVAELWNSTDNGAKMRLLDKYQMILVLGGHKPLERGAQPYQDTALVLRLRNALAHFQPENLSAEEQHRMADQLRRKFPENRLMAGSGNPSWPDHALGHGCAEWALHSVKVLADHVMKTIGIETNYMRHEKTGWLTPNRRRSHTLPE